MDAKIGPNRPLIVLFGSSIVQFSYDRHGWGARLTDLYARKADISLRGYGGWNSNNGLLVLRKVFREKDEIQPSLVILYFGGNDAADLDFPYSPGIPLDKYVANMREIILHIKSLSRNTRVIMLSAPAVNEQQIIDTYGSNLGRTNERNRIYSEAGINLAQELGVRVIDFWSTLQEPEDWLTTVFTDGIHLTEKGSELLFCKIKEEIKKAKWESLDWDLMPEEFSEIVANDVYFEKMMKNMNKSK